MTWTAPVTTPARRAKVGHAYVGTSGFNHRDWRGRFYPNALSSSRWLEFYARRFATVELPVTFYRLPAVATFEQWYADTPETFRFAVKGSRFITHVKRLKGVDDGVRLFMKRARLLREKLVVVLWQLAPTMPVDLEGLTRFLHLLEGYGMVRHVLEVRHSSWLSPQVRELLGRARIALCASDLPSCPVAGEPTTDFFYIRRHGPGPRVAGGSQATTALIQDSNAIHAQLQQGLDVYVYFTNDQHAYAVANAQELIALVYA